MRKFSFIILFFVVIMFFLSRQQASAFLGALIKLAKKTGALDKPIGGKVIGPVPLAVCPNPADSIFGPPIMIKPVTTSPPLSYIVPINAKIYQKFTLKPGSNFLGFYDPTPDVTSCYILPPPLFAPVPIPVFHITAFGSSG